MKMKRIVLALFLILSILSLTSYAASVPGYDDDTGQIILPSEYQDSLMLQLQQQQQDLAEIEAAEERYKAMQQEDEERERINLWERLDREIKLRRYDQMVMGMEREFSAAKAAANPFLGEQGYVIYPYGEVVPIITCRPMRMTDISLEPGEEIMGIHAGDTVRWQFSPSQSMKNGQPVAHIVVKPSQPGISTNLLIHTDRRTYNIDFTSSESLEYLRGVAFSYPVNDLTPIFRKNQNFTEKKSLEDELQKRENDINMDYLYTQYAITDRFHVDWKPEAVFDDGEKTYIRMPFRFSETPAFYVVLNKRESLSNYRVKGRYYIVDRLFDKAVMKIGSKRVVITRKDSLSDSNIKESRALSGSISR